jgi:hypothetical protein
VVPLHDGALSAKEIAEQQKEGRKMPDMEVGDYYLGQRGWIDVLDGAGIRKFRMEGEIVRLIPVSETTIWALIRTRMGTGAYRIW